MAPRLSNHHNATTIILLAVVAIVAFLAWSFWAELDQISRAQGQVIPSGRTQILQSPDGGVIEQIFVREGDRVKKGQLLVKLDRIRLTAAVDESRAQVAALEAALARIDAELFDKPLVFPAETNGFPAFVSNQRLLYQKRRSTYQSTLNTLNQLLSLSRQELAMNEPLLETGDIARSEILKLRRSISDVQGQIDGQRNKYLTDLQTERTQTREELVTAQEALTQRADALGRTDLYSPTNGIVKNVRVTTIGGVLAPGDEMMEIVPTGEELIVEAKVSPSDIAFVRRGQPATVRFDAYDSSIYGAGEGTVTYISPDTLVEQRGSQAPETYYRVTLNVDTSAIRPPTPGEAVEIQPGMTATVEIKTGKNTVFGYLTKPLTKTLDESMTER